MGTISNYNTVQFENANTKDLVGVTLVYTRTNKEGETHSSAVNFSGDEYTPIDKTQDEVFRVWKNVIATFWEVKRAEAGLKEDNGGIASKLRAGTPTEIIVRVKDGSVSKRFDLVETVWKRVGLVPTKRDLEACNRDYKKKIHSAAKASFDALGFRVNFEKIAQNAEIKATTDKKVA